MIALQEPLPGHQKIVLQHGPYSASRLIVARCPQRFFGQYIRKDRSVSSSANAARGNAIHHVFSKITEQAVAKRAITPTQLNAWISEAIGLNPAAYEQIDLVRGATNAYISNPCPYIGAGTSCETALAVSLYEEQSFMDDVVPGRCYVKTSYSDENGFPNKDALFGGRLDLMTIDEQIKTVTIVDHKSTPSASANEDHNFQMGCYAWLASLHYPGYRIRTVLHYAHPDLNFYAAPEYWSQDEIKNFESYILGRIGAVESYAEFPALPGSPCDYCHMKQECPENLALMEQKARGAVDLNVNGADDLKRIASHLRVVGALYDELNSVLKKGIELHSPIGGISIEGMTYKYKASDEAVDWISTDLKIREESLRSQHIMLSPEGLAPEEVARHTLRAKLVDLTAVLKHYGIDPQAFKEWQSHKLKHLFKLDKPELLDMLKGYVVKDKTTRWGAYKN